jgi:D-apiose dehydrogenase
MAQFEVPHYYQDWQEMILSERPDFVDIVTPPDTHERICAFAADQGVHIICQKPLAPSFEQATRIVANAAAAGVRWRTEILRLIQ